MFCVGHGVTAASNKESEFTKADVARVQANSSLVGVPSDYEVISTITRSYIVDGQRDIVNPVGLTGVRLEAEAYVCAAPLTYIQNVRKIVNKAGLDICKDGQLPVAMASSLAVLTDEERDLGAVMLDMGMGTVDMAVYTAKEIGYSAVLAKGGWILTNDVACFFNIAKSEAERLILNFGAASPECLDKDAVEQELKATSASGDSEVAIKRRELAEVIEARLLEIMEWVRDHLKEAREQYGLNASSIVLTGGVSLLPGIAQRFKKELGLPTRVASPCYPTNLPSYLSEPIYSTVVGLLAFGANLIKQNSGEAPEVVYPRKGVVGLFYRICEWFGKVF